METTTFTQPNYGTYYNAIQLCLPIDLSIKIDEKDEVVSFVEAIKEVNLSQYVKPITSHNTHSHDRGMLLKVLLFAHQEGEKDTRKISNLCKRDIRYMWLSNEERPSHMAFERVLNDLKTNIDEVYYDITKSLLGNLEIDSDIQFIDGTKIEANANKNSFVYKKRIINNRETLFQKVSKLIFTLNTEYGYNYRISNTYSSQEIGYICQYLMEVMVQNNFPFQYGKGLRKTKVQRYYDLFLEYCLRLNEYEYWLDILQERNSCSKTDLDATFMATKWDYYNQSGVTRPCYNCQIAVSDGIIVNAEVYQNPGDTLTYIPFMEKYHEQYGNFPKYPMADAGYGSYDNYMFNILHDIELVQKFNMYEKENDPTFQKKRFNSYNWKETEDGYKICPNGRIFNEYVRDKQDTKGKYLKLSQLYKEPQHCEGCPFKEQCLSKEQTSRSYSRNVIQEEFREKVKENLSTDFGKWLKKQRCAQVEGVFGTLKQNYNFTRFTRRGLENVKMEFLLICLGHNLRKYHQYRLDRLSKPSQQLPS